MNNKDKDTVKNRQGDIAAGKHPLVKRERWMIAAIVVLGLTTIGLSGYAIHNCMQTDDSVKTSEVAMEEQETDKSLEQLEVPAQEEISSDADIVEVVTYAGFNADKIINNSKGYSYSTFAEDSRVGLNSISIDEDGKTVSLGVSWYTLADIYQLTGHEDAQQYIVETYDIPFDQAVIGVYTGGYGQAFPGAYYLFFAMEDGSLEYMPIGEAARSGKFASYGTVPGVNGMVDIVQAQVHVPNAVGGWATILARQADGNYVDLMQALDEITQ